MSQPDHIKKISDSLILWLPTNRQGDAAGTRADVERIIEMAKTIDGHVDLLIDVSETEVPNLEQKKIVAAAGQQFHFHRVAVIGYSWRMKLAVDFITRLIGRMDVKLFDNRQEAEAWLKEKK